MTAEYHPGTDIEIPSNVPMSAFRCAIPNPKRYMKPNKIVIDDIVQASFEGDYDRLEEMLSTGDEKNLYNGDINQFHNNNTPLQMAAMAGQTECVELLLQAKADPHIKECVAYGNDPEDGRTALAIAREWGYEELEEMLVQAEKDYKYGWYVPAGITNNKKRYNEWEHGKKPEKGFISSRPGMAEMCGFDASKYGTGPVPKDDNLDAELELGTDPVSLASRPRRLAVDNDLPIGLLFPGQGSQYVKMMSAVKDFPSVEKLIGDANKILGFDIMEICLSGPEEKLSQTKYCQPAIYMAGVAGLERLKNENPEAATRFKVCAGLSLGEYTALHAAGVYSFEDGLKLVFARAKCMESATAACKQLMLSIAGIEKEQLSKLCDEAKLKVKSKEGNAVCAITNELFPKGFSCGGTEQAIYELKDMAEKAGALQAKITMQSGAFHTSLMEPAKQEFTKVLDETLPRMSPPTKMVVMNATGKAIKPGTNPKEIVELMKQQMTNPVQWEASVRTMIKDGISDFYEVGPMKQIKAMMKRIDPKIWGNTSNVEV